LHLITLNKTYTLYMTPGDEVSVGRRDLYPYNTQHSQATRNSYPQSQQASDHRPTP